MIDFLFLFGAARRAEERAGDTDILMACAAAALCFRRCKKERRRVRCVRVCRHA